MTRAKEVINMLGAGSRVKTALILGNTGGMLVVEKHLSSRKPNTEGILINPVPGHGGDVWFMQHDYASEASVYSLAELALLDNPEDYNLLKPKS